jgi:hypothetical protein
LGLEVFSLTLTIRILSALFMMYVLLNVPAVISLILSITFGFAAPVFIISIILVIGSFTFNFLSIISLSLFGIFQFFSYSFKRSDSMWTNCRKFRVLNIILNGVLGMILCAKLLIAVFYIVVLVRNYEVFIFGDFLVDGAGGAVTKQCSWLSGFLIVCVIASHFILVVYMFDRKEWALFLSCVGIGKPRNSKRNSVVVPGLPGLTSDVRRESQAQYHLLETINKL